MGILGYGHCRRCETLTPTAVLERSTGLCETCITDGALPRPRTVVRVGSNVIPLRPTIKIKGSKGSTETRRRTRQAHHAAAKRLRDCFPELYRLLYMGERAARGLPPVTLFATGPIDTEALQRALDAAGERVDTSAFYDAAVEEA